MGNKKFSVLNLSQVYGDGKLDVFNRYGSEAEVTDYAISRGTDYYPLKGKYLKGKGLPSDSPLNDKKACDYWTSSRIDGSASKCYAYGKYGASPTAVWSDNLGTRVAVPVEDIKNEIVSSYTEDYGNGEFTTLVYGEYPIHVLSYDEKHTLDNLYKNNELRPTGKTYAAWGIKTELFFDGVERNVERDEYPEYEYNGMKFVKANNAVFENGGDRSIWAVVEPVEWLLDEKSGLAITKNCILGGIPLNRKGIYFGNFDNTMVQEFLDTEFVYDISNKDVIIKNSTDNTELLDTYEDLLNIKRVA